MSAGLLVLLFCGGGGILLVIFGLPVANWFHDKWLGAKHG